MTAARIGSLLGLLTTLVMAGAAITADRWATRADDVRAYAVFAGIGAGADGLIIEVHPESDGAQSLDFAQFETMMPKIARVAEAVDPTFHRVAAPAA